MAPRNFRTISRWRVEESEESFVGGEEKGAASCWGGVG